MTEQPNPDTTVELDEIQSHVDEWLAATFALRHWKGRAQKARRHIVHHMLKHSGGTGTLDGEPVVRLKVSARCPLDTARLRQERPDIADEYTGRRVTTYEIQPAPEVEP